MSSTTLLSALLAALVVVLQLSSTHSADLTFTTQSRAAQFSGRANANVEALSRRVAYFNNGQQLYADNPLILNGNDNLPHTNDVWLSPDQGANWYLISGIARTPNGGSVAAPGNHGDDSYKTLAAATGFTTDGNNNIFRIQGQVAPPQVNVSGNCTSDTWWSQDGGITWQLRGSTSPMPARKFGAAISDRANNLYLLGGVRCEDWATQYDVWRSTNQGASWQRRATDVQVDGPAVGVLLNVPKAPRANINVQEALVFTTGWENGQDFNTVFSSIDGGATWGRYFGAAAFSARDDANGEVTAAGLIIIVGGKRDFVRDNNAAEEYLNDVWVSGDGGWTWGLCVRDAPFSDRRYFMTALDTQGHLYVIGGEDASGTKLNDVYRSTISFNDPGRVYDTCGVEVPPCGYGITCLPGDPTLVRLPRGVTCAAAQACGGPMPDNSTDFIAQTTRAPWSARSSPFAGLLTQPITYTDRRGTTQRSPANSFILYGQREMGRDNDVWISTDRMASWSLISGVSYNGVPANPNGNRPPTNAQSFSAPVPAGPAYAIASNLRPTPSNRMYLISGDTGNNQPCSNRVWTSTDGISWTSYTITDAWTPRMWAQLVISPSSGSLILFGGRTCGGASQSSLFDAWRSDNNGQSWRQVTATGFNAMGPRNGISGIWTSPVLGREVIIYASGWADADYNDVVASSDLGASWTVLTTAAQWQRRDDMAGLVTPDGVMVLIGGKTALANGGELFHNDIWVSMDGGYKWGRCKEDVAFTDRRYTTATLDEQGHLYVVAGQTNQGQGGTNEFLADAWRSTISFARSELSHVAATCGMLAIPQCGPGLNCWPGTPGFQRLPRGGVTCPACPSTEYVPPVDFTQVTTRAPWSPRSHANMELLSKQLTYTPVGSSTPVTIRNALVVQGHTNLNENDIWASSNHGETWALIGGITASGARATSPADQQSFNPKASQTAFAYDPAGSYIYRIGGRLAGDNNCYGGVQYSSDGKRWIEINTGNGANAISPRRELAAAITDSKGVLYVTGGRMCGQNNGLEDVWRSVDHGLTWTRRTANAPWGWRLAHLLLSVRSPRISSTNPDMLIQLGGWTGGVDTGDIWASSDGGAKWEMITIGAAWDKRDDMNGEVTPAGLLIVSGGKSEKQEGTQRITEIYNDVWVSADGGYTWGQCIADAAFDDRRYQMTALDEQGHLIVAGGESSAGQQLNDVWRSTVSFTDLNAIRACGVTIPSCGIGLSCLPSSPGFRRLPGNAGVTCNACRNNAGYNRMDFVRVCGSASWSPRSRGNVESMKRPIQWTPLVGTKRTAPAHSLVLQGNSNYQENDVWISTDQGQVWELMAGWSKFGRSGDVGAQGAAFTSSFINDTFAPAYTQDSNGNIYRIQGELTDGGACSTEIWMSSNGAQWQQQYKPAANNRGRLVPTRLYAGAIGDSHGNIFVAGGRDCTGAAGQQERNDVWMSTDRGVSWTQQTAAAQFGRRAVFQFLSATSAVLQKDVLHVFSGWSGSADYNDVWASSDQGRTWRMLTARAPWMSRDDANAEITSKGLIVLTSGKAERNAAGQSEILNDVWVSADGGYTWGQCIQDASYTDRRYQMTLMDDQDYLYVIGGEQSNGRQLNDVWRSSISFADVSSVQAACGIRIPVCGAGLNCWPNMEGFSITKGRGATCAACEAAATCYGDDCAYSGSSGGLVPQDSSSGLSTAGILAIIILVALAVVGMFFGYKYWQRVGAQKAADGALLDAETGDSSKETSTSSAGEGSTNGSYTAPAQSQATA